MIARRRLVGAVAASVAAGVAWAKTSAKVHRIGLLGNGAVQTMAGSNPDNRSQRTLMLGAGRRADGAYTRMGAAVAGGRHGWRDRRGLQGGDPARVGALLVTGAGLLFPRAREGAELASKSRLAAIYELRPFVEAAGLMSYGVDLDAIFRRAAAFSP